MFPEIDFDEKGLVPCVAQDFASGEVLTLAYANEESLRLTVETGEMHFFSRSRGKIWRKGEESGNVLKVRQLRYDCDGDALLALVEPTGPACHTGERSCFYRELGGAASPEKDAPGVSGEPSPVPAEALPVLERTLRSRAAERPDGFPAGADFSENGRRQRLTGSIDSTYRGWPPGAGLPTPRPFRWPIV